MATIARLSVLGMDLSSVAVPNVCSIFFHDKSWTEESLRTEYSLNNLFTHDAWLYN